MVIVPAGHRVMIKPDDVEKKTASGIVLPVDEKKEKAATVIGTIVAIGPNAWRAFDDGLPWATIGDRVYYIKYAGKFVGKEEEFIVVNDEDIIAVIRED